MGKHWTDPGQPIWVPRKPFFLESPKRFNFNPKNLINLFKMCQEFMFHRHIIIFGVRRFNIYLETNSTAQNNRVCLL